MCIWSLMPSRGQMKKLPLFRFSAFFSRFSARRKGSLRDTIFLKSPIQNQKCLSRMCVRTAAARKKRTADPASARRPLSESSSFAIYFGRHTRRFRSPKRFASRRHISQKSIGPRFPLQITNCGTSAVPGTELFRNVTRLLTMIKSPPHPPPPLHLPLHSTPISNFTFLL